MGMGQNESTRNWTAGFSPWFHLPGFHFGLPIFDPQRFLFHLKNLFFFLQQLDIKRFHGGKQWLIVFFSTLEPCLLYYSTLEMRSGLDWWFGDLSPVF